MAGAVCLLGKLGRGCGGGTPGLFLRPQQMPSCPTVKAQSLGIAGCSKHKLWLLY